MNVFILYLAVEDQSTMIDKQLYKGNNFSQYCTLNSWIYIYRLFILRYKEEIKMPSSVLEVLDYCTIHEFKDLSIDKKALLLISVVENLYDCENVLL